MMLYSESFEGPSPLLTRAAPPKGMSIVRTWWMDRTLEPRIDVGVALGCSDSCVVTSSRVAQFPSMLALNAKGKMVALGDEANALEGREPEGVRIIRPFQGGALNDFLGGRRLLEAGLKMARFALSAPPALVLATSTEPSPLERETWIGLARAVGAREAYLCSQLVLAAVGAGKAVLEPRARLVMNIGAGSLEIGVVAMGSCLFSRRFPGGGDMLTELITDYVRRQHHLLVHWRDAETVKKALVCEWNDSECEGSHLLVGRQVDLGHPGQVVVTTQELRELLRPVLEEWVGHVKQALSEVSLDWLVDIAEEGLLLAGGGARLSGLEKLLKGSLELPVEVASSPDRAVSEGLRQILVNGELRHALLAPSPVLSTTGDYRMRKRQVTSKVWGSGMAAALLAGCFFLSVHSSEGTPGGPLSPLVVGGLAAYEQAETHWQAKPEPNWSKVEQAEKQHEIERLASENKRLWGWLGERKESDLSDAQPVLAKVVGRSPEGWLSRWTLDVGSEQGIEKGQVVISQDGLVGQVAEVSEGSCRVRPFLNSDSVVAGRIHSRHSAGVVLGRGLANVEMRYLDPDAGIKRGDKVYTSGQDGQYPAGIPLGTVSQTQRQMDSSFLSAVINPAVSFGDVREVMVLKHPGKSVTAAAWAPPDKHGQPGPWVNQISWTADGHLRFPGTWTE